MLSFDSKKIPARYRELWQYIRPHRYALLTAALLMAIVAGINSSIPFLIRSVLDRVFVAKEERWLLPLAGIILLLFTVKGVVSYLQGLITGKVGQEIIYELRKKLLDHLLTLDLPFYQSKMSGELLSRVLFDTSQVQNAVTRAITGLFQHILMIIGLMGVALYLHYKLALFAFFVLPLAFYPIYRFGELVRNHWRRGQEEMATLQASLLEMVQGIRVIKGFLLEGSIRTRLLHRLHLLLETFLKVVRIQAGSQPLMEWIGALGMAVVIVIGGRWVITGEMTTGTFFAFLSSIFLLYDPVRKLNGTWMDLQQGISAGERIQELLHTKPLLSFPHASVPKQEFKKRILFSRVSFRYHPGDPLVLQEVELEIPRGRKLAIVGPSGEGKSTLLDLLMRFYDPSEGAIFIDDVHLKEIAPQDLYRLIARVDQHPVLFSGTILENIWMGDLSAPREAVLRAARLAQVEPIVASLPKGWETPVGEGGSKLSGGERQRIAIARALLRKAPILLLDEATSALDSEREQNLLVQLMEELPDTTIIFIAHRFKIARVAEEIAVLHSGRIVEQGSHQELLLRNGVYAHLFSLAEELPHGESEMETP